MKTLLSVLLLFTIFATHAQDNPRGILYGIALGGTNYREFDVSMEVSVVKSRPRFYASIVADAFTAKRPVLQQWTTLQIGGRLNMVTIRQAKANRLVLFGGYKYLTQGNERLEALNAWFWEAGTTFLHKIESKKGPEAWLKFSLNYENTPNERLFCSLGIQTIL